MTLKNLQNSINKYRKGALIIFSKPPVPGQVKTRLIPEIGRKRAASLYQDLLTKTLITARKADYSAIQVWVNGNAGHRYFNRLQSRHCINLYDQRGSDLGQRMYNAFNTTLGKYPYAVLIGSDCPSLTTSDLKLATEYLDNKADVVLGPADDGGYYLIGLKKNSHQLFSGIDWGKETVFSETCSRIEDLNLKLELLSKRTDLDRTSDLFPYFRMKRQESVLYY